MIATENGLHTPGTRQRLGACHIWHMLVPQLSATRAPIARRADALSSAGLCVWSPSRQRIRPSRACRPDTVHELQSEQRRSRAAFQVRSRDRNPRPNQSSEHDTRKRRVSCIVYFNTYTIPKTRYTIHTRLILCLQFSIVVQQNFINFSHNFAKFSRIFLKLSYKFLNFLKIFNIFKIANKNFQSCSKICKIFSI